MSDLDFTVTSQTGPYEVTFESGILDSMVGLQQSIVIIDQRVADLYRDRFAVDLRDARTVFVLASEETKSLERLPYFVEQLVALDVRKNDGLIAIGGGVTQDIVAFLATVMFRGMSWSFIPTTLLAQADSCIGSKSSINAAGTKNLVGTFRAPTSVSIDVDFLKTLSEQDVLSGIGEMLKVHAIAGPAEFDAISSEYEVLLSDTTAMQSAVHRSLLTKRNLIQVDEFDRGPRNVMNYGHSFGHAIEIATDYEIPHGIAVTIGMDMANFVAAELGFSSADQFKRMHSVLQRNSAGFASVDIRREPLMTALRRDKKNTATHLRLVLPDTNGHIGMVSVAPDTKLEDAVDSYLSIGRSL